MNSWTPIKPCKPNKKIFRLDACSSNSGSCCDINIKTLSVSFNIEVIKEQDIKLLNKFLIKNLTKKELKQLLKLTV